MSSNDDQVQDSDYVYSSTILVDKGQEPMRIDKFLMGRIEKVSRNRVQTAIKTGAILVNEGMIKANYKVRPNDIIKLLLPKDPSEQHEILPEDLSLIHI